MAWKALDRVSAVAESQAVELSQAVRDKIAAVFGRYATKRAALLPALHIVQDTYGYVPPTLVPQIAELLEIRPADVLDTLSFYTHFWTHPKGRTVITVCRSLSCELMGSSALIEACKQHMHCDEHGSSADGRYALLVEECIAACEKAPCMIVGEKLHGPVRPDQVAALLSDPAAEQIDVPRVTTFCKPDSAA